MISPDLRGNSTRGGMPPILLIWICYFNKLHNANFNFNFSIVRIRFYCQNRVYLLDRKCLYKYRKENYLYSTHPEQQPQSSDDGRLLANAIGVRGGEAISSDIDDI